MKILIYGLNFAPELTGVGKFTGEMASWLVAAGHDVRVITAPPYYPEWEVASGYRGDRYQRETRDGIIVQRCPLFVSKSRSAAGRALLQLSFVLSSLPVLLWQAIFWRPRVIFTTIPAVSGLPNALMVAFLAGAKSWAHVQDLEIDAAFELGIVKSRWVRSAFLAAERYMLSRFHVVSSITNAMLNRLEDKRINSDLVIFPNWADLGSIRRTAGSPELRRELGIDENEIVALYSGNLGEKQGVDDLIDVAKRLENQRNVVVVVCGASIGRDRLAIKSHGVGNFRLHALQPQERLSELLNMADIHLLPQKAEVADLVMPSKLGGMLASGRPVIAATEPCTQLAQEIEGCGIVVPPGDPAALATAVKTLATDPILRQNLGNGAEARAKSHWNKAKVLATFEAKLRAIADA